MRTLTVIGARVSASRSTGESAAARRRRRQAHRPRRRRARASAAAPAAPADAPADGAADAGQGRKLRDWPALHARARTDGEGRRAEGHGPRVHDGLEGQQDLPRHRPQSARRVVPYTRQVAVYVPAQYVAGTPAPFIVVQDGMSATYRDNLPPILDNLIHEKRVPAMVAVMVHNGGGDAQGSQRGLEYDTVSGVYTRFHRDGSAAAHHEGLRHRVHQGSRRPRDDGRQFGRGVRVHDGVVPSGAVSPRALVLGNLREPAVAAESRDRRAARGSITRRSSPTARPSRSASGCT